MNAYFTFNKLTGPSGKDLAATFERMAEMLHETSDKGKLQFEIITGNQSTYWLVDINAKSSTAKAAKNDEADFDLITDADTWWELANGTLSPLRAFVQHRIRIKGNLSLGKKMLMNLSSQNQ